MLTSGKGTWGEVSKLIGQENWEHVYIITTDFGKEKFTCEKPHTFIIINSFGTVEEIKTKLIESLKNKISLDVGVNFISGTGKEHMALLSSLLELGVGIRLIISGEKEFKEI
jgi:hypothetical protein